MSFGKYIYTSEANSGQPQYCSLSIAEKSYCKKNEKKK